MVHVCELTKFYFIHVALSNILLVLLPYNNQIMFRRIFKFKQLLKFRVRNNAETPRTVQTWWNGKAQLKTVIETLHSNNFENRAKNSLEALIHPSEACEGKIIERSCARLEQSFELAVRSCNYFPQFVRNEKNVLCPFPLLSVNDFEYNSRLKCFNW